MSRRERLLVIGNGMAGVRLCEEIARRCPTRFDVTVVGAEPRPGYNRVLLSSYLAGDSGEADVILRDQSWYEGVRIKLYTGRAVTRLKLEARVAKLSDGTLLSFDKLVFATGSQPIRLTKPGMDLPGVMTFRDLGDVDIMRQAAGVGMPAVVIGGGLLGIEAAYGLSRAGARVTLVHIMDRLMERQLDARAARFLKTAIERKGIKVVLGADSAAVIGDHCAEGLQLADGRVLPARMVVMAVGIRSNVALAASANLAVNRGILVNDRMESTVEDVFALGECAEHRGVVYGLVEPAYQQAAVLASNLAGTPASYPGSVLATNLKVSGVGVFSAGDFEGTAAGARAITLEDRSAGSYRKLVVSGDRLTGCVLVGDTADGLWYRDLIRSEQSIAAMRDDLIFGQDVCRPVGDEQKAAA
jgi:nitrite reductase (NADH) large subunit